MAKSIRSKVKRQHRAEFRRTIGEVRFSSWPKLNCCNDRHTWELTLPYSFVPQEAAQKAMKVVQSKIKEVVEKGSMTSFSRLSTLLDTQKDEDETEDMVDDSIVALPAAEALGHKGENKILAKKTGMKYGSKKKLKTKTKKEGATPVKKERRKPKYFCEFK